MRQLLKRLWTSEPLNVLRRLKQKLFPRPEYIGIRGDHPLRFTEKSTGLIHIGAHEGEEAWIYDALKVPRVIWVEADPELMDRLRAKISQYRGHLAVESLLTERAGELVKFHVTNNDGASSSILPLGRCTEMYPEIEVTGVKELRSNTLDDLLTKLDPVGLIDTMVIDVQGAELAVLKGAAVTLRQFRRIFAECADFELYQGCCTLASLSEFLRVQGFIETARHVAKETAGVGSAYDILFERIV